MLTFTHEEEEMLTQTEKRYYTPEEYFALEEQAEYKSEYHAGEIILSYRRNN